MSRFLGYDMDPGLIPLVVGVVSTPEGLEKAADQTNWPCDVIEVRLDLIGPDYIEWTVAANRLSHAGMGTLLTIRHVSEGGRWSGEESRRRDLYLDNMQHVNGIDVELHAKIMPEIMRDRDENLSVIGSFHNFRGMPSGAELQKIADEAAEAGVDVAKVAAFASSPADLQKLLNLVETNSERAICAVAMGPMAEESRVALPVAGSCLTYGYLDEPNAPGQPSAKTIREKLTDAHEEYRAFIEFQSSLNE